MQQVANGLCFIGDIPTQDLTLETCIPAATRYRFLNHVTDRRTIRLNLPEV